MKKIIITLCLFANIGFAQSAKTFSVTNISFTDSVCQGSTQWVDIKQVSTTVLADTVFIYINPAANTTSAYAGLLNKVAWNLLSVNSDGSRGMNFIIPISYQGYFDLRVGINKNQWNTPGYTIPTDNNGRCSIYCAVYADIEKYTSTNELLTTEYYNLLGQPISEPNGITVEIKTYKDGSRWVRKIIR